MSKSKKGDSVTKTTIEGKTLFESGTVNGNYQTKVLLFNSITYINLFITTEP